MGEYKDAAGRVARENRLAKLLDKAVFNENTCHCEGKNGVVTEGNTYGAIRFLTQLGVKSAVL